MQTTEPAVHATETEIDTATRAGAEAYARPSAPAAPSLCPVIRDLIADAPVGQPRTLELFRAWSSGWNAAAVAVIETEQA